MILAPISLNAFLLVPVVSIANSRGFRWWKFGFVIQITVMWCEWIVAESSETVTL